MSAQPPIFYLGAMSPYSWLAAERIEGLLGRARWRALFAGGLFKRCGRVSWGLTERRAAEMAKCERRARARGLGRIEWPDPWPTNDLMVARAMTFASSKGLLETFALAAMRLSFREGADLGERSAVLEAGLRAGLDPSELDAALADPQVKLALRDATEAALSAGVFGMPTVAVGDQLFWGDDRLEEAAAAARHAAEPAR